MTNRFTTPNAMGKKNNEGVNGVREKYNEERRMNKKIVS